MNRSALVFATAFFALYAAGPAYAKTGDKLRQVEEQLSEQKQQQEELDATARETSKGLADLRQRMIRSTQTLQQKETEEETLEDKLDNLTQQISIKSKSAAQDRKQLGQMVSALVEIASRPPESLFLQERITQDHVHRSLLLHAILPRLKEQTETAGHDLTMLYDLKTQLSEQKRLVAAAQENLQKQQHDLDQLIATRQGLLQRTEAQKAETAQHLAALADQARDLRQLMEKVSTPRATPRKNVTRSGVALKWPVAGSVRKNFGDKDADGVTSEGMTLAAPSGAPVVAPLTGRVVFVGPFRGYGQIMILQHDNGYHSFLAGFGRIDAEMGQEVSAGEPLGVLPVKNGGRPELYFEWRRGDQPMDPASGLESRAS